MVGASAFGPKGLVFDSQSKAYNYCKFDPQPGVGLVQEATNRVSLIQIFLSLPPLPSLPLCLKNNEWKEYVGVRIKE